MSLRDILIRWLGGYTRSEYDAMESHSVALAATLKSCRKRVADAENVIASNKAYRKSLENALKRRTERLQQIASLETPNANGTVRKMARIARGHFNENTTEVTCQT